MIFEALGIHLPGLSEWITILGGFYGAWGYPAILLAAAIENTLLVTLIFPGGTMVLLGGVYAGLGILDLPSVIAVGWVGTFLGASFDYAIGRGGHAGPTSRLLRKPMLAKPLERAGRMLARYGLPALIAGHFISHIRSLVAVAAGLTGMPYLRFALFEAPAALLWAGAYAIGGYFLADQIPLFEEILTRFGGFLAAGISLFVAWQVWRSVWSARTDQTARLREASAGPGPELRR
ncbi:MAG: DedA family protein [Chloroflexota bacterium]|nr:MAG: DedA family protein [Chloroflexota bacterium]